MHRGLPGYKENTPSGLIRYTASGNLAPQSGALIVVLIDPVQPAEPRRGVLMLTGKPLTPNEMRHLGGDLQGELDDAAEFALFHPGGLVDDLFTAVFFDGVDILLVGDHDLFDLFSRLLIVAIHQVPADQACTAIPCIVLNGVPVHVDDDAGGIADDDVAVEGFDKFHAG
jgi:hypothetical protein